MRHAQLSAMTKGWFVGNFAPTAYATDDCEVGVKRYLAGDREAAHVHKIATELTLIVSGRVRMNGRDFGEGDIVILDPGTPSDFEVVEDAVTIVVKVPCIAGDKYPYPESGVAA
jgi:hypothetical protein